MINLPETWFAPLLLGAMSLSLLSLLLAYSCYVRLRKQSGLVQKLFTQLDRKHQAANSGAIGMGKRLITLEKLLAQMEAEQEVLSKRTEKAGRPVVSEPSVAAPAELTDAANLLGAGVEIEEVARRCGISSAEASLMKLLQSQLAAEQSDSKSTKAA